jgi:hypothetical protein
MQSVDPAARVRLLDLTLYMRAELAKMRHMFSLSFYVLCTSLLIALLCTHRVSFLSSNAPLYFQLEVEHVFNAKGFRQLQQPTDFYVWLRTALVDTAAKFNNGSSMRILDTISIRQLRDGLQSCDNLDRHTDGVDPLTLSAMHDDSCVVSVDGAAPSSFGTNGSFVLATSTNLVGFNHVADFYDMIDMNRDRTYQFTLQINGSAAPVLTEQVDFLQTNEFIDNLTAMVAMDTVVLFPQNDILVVATFIIEVTTTGMFSVKASTDTFKFFTTDKGVVAIDVFIFLSFTLVLLLLAIDVHERYATQPQHKTSTQLVVRVLRSVGPWELCTLVLIGSILAVTSMRFDLWRVSSSNINNSVGNEAFNVCVQTFQKYQRIYEIYCVCLVLVAFRLFYSFRYISGLNKLTNTLRDAAPDLLRIFSLWVVLLVIFAIAGCMIFGRDIFGFRTFMQSISFLTTTLISAELPDDVYREMLRTQGAVADAYLVALFVIFWLVLLNLVIAIITSRLITSEQSETAMSAESLIDLIQTYVLYQNERLYAVDRVAHKRNQHSDTMSPSQRLASKGLQMMLPLALRFRVLTNLRQWRLKTYMAVVQQSQEADMSAFQQRTVTYAEVMEIVTPHDALLRVSQLSSAQLVSQMFLHVQRRGGAILNTVNESRELYLRMLDVLAVMHSRLGTLARELRRYRNINTIGGEVGVRPGGGSSTTDGKGRTRAATASGGLQRSRPRGRSVMQLEHDPALAKEHSFAVRDDGDVAEFDSSGSSVESAVGSDNGEGELCGVEAQPGAAMSTTSSRGLLAADPASQSLDHAPPPALKSVLRHSRAHQRRSLSLSSDSDGAAQPTIRHGHGSGKVLPARTTSCHVDATPGVHRATTIVPSNLALPPQAAPQAAPPKQTFTDAEADQMMREVLFGIAHDPAEPPDFQHIFRPADFDRPAELVLAEHASRHPVNLEDSLDSETCRALTKFIDEL